MQRHRVNVTLEDLKKIIHEVPSCDACRSCMPYPLKACLCAWGCDTCRMAIVDTLKSHPDVMWPLVQLLDLGPELPEWGIPGINCPSEVAMDVCSPKTSCACENTLVLRNKRPLSRWMRLKGELRLLGILRDDLDPFDPAALDWGTVLSLLVIAIMCVIVAIMAGAKL